MDTIKSIYDIVKDVVPTIWTYVKYQLCFGDFVNEFRARKESLQSRQEVVKSRMQTETQRYPGKIESREIRTWLDKGERIIQDIEDKFSKVRCISHICVAKYLDEKKRELKEIFDEGEMYTKDDAILVVDDHSRKGVALPVPELQGRGATKTKILNYLVEEKFTRIAVCGLGGIGKTTIMKHVHNDLLKEAKFKKVVFVTVSKEFNAITLQKDIARKLQTTLPDNEDENTCAGLLFEMLKNGSYLIILDDVWKDFVIEDVGIPNWDGSNGCKLVLTTRFRDVAQRMGCKVIDVESLPKEEAMQLFLSKVGNAVLSGNGGIKRALQSVLKQIVEECGGLPLAIVTIARTMKEISSAQLWENELNDLRKRKRSVASTRIVEGVPKDAFEILRFSYDHLIDQKIQYCFLYCALYPEDYAIPKRELIQYWIEEGFIDEMKTRHEMNCKGHAILKKLEDNYLLESVKTIESRLIEDEDEEAVRMHDLLRAMALDITHNSPRFLVKAGMNMRKPPNNEEWTEDLETVSLMWNSIEKIPRDLSSPKCQMLTTLLLSHNNLSTIPESFFQQMNGLKILDLSYNCKLESLPSSISKLEKLTTLLLKCCELIAKVPDLSNCLALTKLDLNESGIEEVPEGVQMLVNLKYVDFSLTKIKKLPEGILPKLSCLQSLGLGIPGIEVKAEELGTLRKLEYFDGLLRDWNEMITYMEMMKSEGNWLRDYKLEIGGGTWIETAIPILKRVIRITCLPTISGKPVLLPHDVEAIEVQSCHDFRYLNQLSFLNDAINLTTCTISYCERIEFAFSMQSNFNPLQTLQNLALCYLENLESLFEEKALPLSTGSFPLKFIGIGSCPKIKKLFLPGLLLGNLQNLESIFIDDCEALEEVIASEESEEKEEAKVKLPLPKLKIFAMSNLPNLKSICGASTVLVCNPLENFGVTYCMRLERVPLHLPKLDNGHPPPSLKEIKVYPKELWESMEWDNPNAKDVLLPFCDFTCEWWNKERNVNSSKARKGNEA